MPRTRKKQPTKGQRRRNAAQRIRNQEPTLDDLRLLHLGGDCRLKNGWCARLDFTEGWWVLSLDTGLDQQLVYFFTGGGRSIQEYPWPGAQPVESLFDYVQPSTPKEGFKKPWARSIPPRPSA